MTAEQALLERAKEYDRAALGELYDIYAPQVYAYIYRRLGDPYLAEDLVGDVFVRVVHAIRWQRPWHTSFRAWLYRIAHNVVVDHYRRRKPLLSDSLDEIWVPESEKSLNPAAQDPLETERLRRALRCLTQDQQEVLVLRFAQGLTVRETAHVLHKTAGSVKAAQHRAIASLRRMMVEEAKVRPLRGKEGLAQRGSPSRPQDQLQPDWKSGGGGAE